MDKDIVNKIMNSKRVLGVNSKELVGQFMQAGLSHDLMEMKEIYMAYQDWYLSEFLIDEINFEDVQEAKSSCDFFCKIADEYIRIGNFEKALEFSCFPVELPLGKIRRFYRFAIDYHPKNPFFN
ncbi:MAG: hypothetical protein KJ949_01490 [Nanoarchaeota archaeon]|nr:hypothetical protein [Nanoarchaeota archaeon]